MTALGEKPQLNQPEHLLANVGFAADTVACFAGSRPSFARLAQSARREAARASEPGLVLQININPVRHLAWRG
jgi:hypothetical protein